MKPSTRFGADWDSGLQVLWEDGERVLCRGENHTDGNGPTVLAVLPAAEHPTPATLDRLAHEYGLRDDLDDGWAARPLEFVRKRGQTKLVLKDLGGEPLDRLIGSPMEMRTFLRLAVALSAALGRLHERGLIHKDIKPANVLVSSATDQVVLSFILLVLRAHRRYRIVIGVGGRASSMGRTERFSRGNSD